MIRLTNKPQRGDAVLGVLGTGSIVFATYESLMAGTLDTTKYEYIGPVLRRIGKKVFYCYHTATDQKWAERYSFALTGFTLDGTDRSGKINLWTSGSTARDTTYTINYNASTVDQLVQQLNTAFSDNVTYPFLASQDWFAEKTADNGITLHFTFSDFRQASNNGSNGFTLTANLLPGAKALANIRRRNGYVGGEGVISQWERALAFFRNDQPSGSYNPAADVTTIKLAYPVCLPAYLGTSANNTDHCALLRQTYGPGEAGWLKFMESCLPVDPSDWGNWGQNDGKARTVYLAAQRFSSRTQSDKPLCPAADYAVNISTSVLPKGTFWMPTCRQVYHLLKGIKYGTINNRNADRVNALQYKMGKGAINNGTYTWSCSRGLASGAFSAIGGSGFFSYNSMGSWLRAFGVSLYELA